MKAERVLIAVVAVIIMVVAYCLTMPNPPAPS